MLFKILINIIILIVIGEQQSPTIEGDASNWTIENVVHDY